MHQEGRGWLDFVQLREVTAENHYVMHLSQLSYDQARAGSNEFKEVLLVLMLCAPVFTSGSSALSGRPRCGLLI